MTAEAGWRSRAPFEQSPTFTVMSELVKVASPKSVITLKVMTVEEST